MYQPVDVAKTHEILARFRPIAPKPQLARPRLAAAPTPALQYRARPCRTRKRGRTIPSKRQKAAVSSTSPFLSFSPSLRETQPLVERDLLQNLQTPKIIAPRPVRPVGSTIIVGLISEGTTGLPPPAAPKRPNEVEDEIESETLPAVVSDSNNRVRLANSAYKELVGQPECMWLDTMVSSSGGRGFGLRPTSRRINGEVMLEFSGDSSPPLGSLEGFSCRVKIVWTCNEKKNFIVAPCDVIRVYCESKDYYFVWKFHIDEVYLTDNVS